LEVLKQKINKFVDEKIKALEKNLTTGAWLSAWIELMFFLYF
jgi:hypothetical protein